MSDRKPCNIKRIESSRDANPLNITATTQAIFIIFLVGFVGGISTVYGLKAAGITASIGAATNKDAFDVGSWFRYDYSLMSEAVSSFYVVTNITGITTAGDPIWGDSVAASVLGSNARWYKWSIKVYNKVTSVEVPSSVYKTTLEWTYHLRFLIDGYSNRSLITINNIVKTDRYHTARPMFVSYGLTSSDTAILGAIGGIFSSLEGKSLFLYPSQTAYDTDTGILLYMRRTQSNYQYHFLVLTGFSVKNPLSPVVTPPPAKPLFDLVTPSPSDGVTSTAKRIVITNHDPSVLYEMSILSTNSSVIASYGMPTIPFSSGTYDLNVLKPGTTTLTIKIRAVKSGIRSDFTTIAFSVDTRPAVIPPTAVPSQPGLTVTPAATTNGTIVLTWTSSSNYPVSYEIYMKVAMPFSIDTDASLIAVIASTMPTNHTHTATLTNGFRFFRVRAVNAIGKSPFSALGACNVQMPTPPVFTPPTAPTLSTPTVANGNINSNVSLSWSASIGATSYNIYRKIDANIVDTATAMLVNTTASTTFIDTLQPLYAQTVYYAVTAKNSTGESALSGIKSIVVTINTTYAPTMTIMMNGTVISWSAVSHAIKYTVYMNNVTNFYTGDVDSIGDVPPQTTIDLNGTLPNGTWNITVTVTTSIDDYESHKSNSLLMTISGSTPGVLDYHVGNPVPFDSDIVVLVMAIIAGVAAILLFVMSRRGMMVKKR